MIQTFHDRTMASGLESTPASTGERRRHASHLVSVVRSSSRDPHDLSAVASALPGCKEARHLRERFESELRDLLHARDVELRDGSAMARPPDSTLSVEVSAGELTLGSIDAVFDEGFGAFDDWDRELIESARELAALVLIIDRVQRAGGLGVRGRGPAGRRGGADRGIDAGDPRRPRADRARRGDRVHRLDRGRERRRQGAGGAADSRSVAAARRSVRGGELRGDRRDAARGGAVRDRGSDRDRRSRAPRQVRERARGDTVSRRGRRPVAGRAGEAAARDPGDVDRACRRRGAARRQHADHRGDEQHAGGARRPRPFPARSLLPAPRRGDRRAAAARAARTTSSSWPSTFSSATATSAGCGSHRPRPMPCWRTGGRATSASSNV